MTNLDKASKRTIIKKTEAVLKVNSNTIFYTQPELSLIHTRVSPHLKKMQTALNTALSKHETKLQSEMHRSGNQISQSHFQVEMARIQTLEIKDAKRTEVFNITKYTVAEGVLLSYTNSHEHFKIASTAASSCQF